MAVPEGKRGEGKLRVFTKANALTIYTIKICTNPKIFLPQYQNALTNDIIRTAKNIFIYLWTANNIDVRTPKTPEQRVRVLGNYGERRRLQEAAARECNNLLALMQMAQALFHLKTKRIKYWGQMTIEVRDMIRKWQESDIKRSENL